jgi:DNA-binding NarL/FixJ family response regulator
MKNILIADDHATVRSGLRAIVESHAGWEVVAEADDGKKAATIAIEKRPDVAIIDYSMPSMTGLDVTRCIKKDMPATEVLIFTMHDTEELAFQALQAGAKAFLVKSEANKLLLAAIESLMGHKTFFSGVFSRELKLLAAGKQGRNHMQDRSHMLTLREETVVKLVAEGYSNKGISGLLNLSIKTIETHRAAAMRKLNINSTAGLVRYAVRNMLVQV